MHQALSLYAVLSGRCVGIYQPDGSVFAGALVFKNSAFNLPSPSTRPISVKAKKKDESEKYHQSPGKEFIPACVDDFPEDTRQVFSMNKSSDEMLKNFKDQGKKTKYNHLVQGGKINGQ